MAIAGQPMIKVSALTLTNLLKDLVNGPFAVREMSEHTGLHPQTIRAYLRAMHREKLVHIAGWEVAPDGRHKYPLWKFGNAKDAPRLPRVSKVEANREWRRRKQALTKPAWGLMAEELKSA